MKKELFDITGMSCSACSSRIQKAVSTLNGVEDVNVNLLKNNMTVHIMTPHFHRQISLPYLKKFRKSQ